MTNLLLLGFLPSGSEWIIIALVILLLFGGKKIPELMRGLGKGVKSFKDGVNEAKDEINKAKDELDKPNSNYPKKHLTQFVQMIPKGHFCHPYVVLF